MLGYGEALPDIGGLGGRAAPSIALVALRAAGLGERLGSFSAPVTDL